jgi:hypothetical protein
VLATGISQFDIQLGVVNMADLKRPVAMTRRLHFQFHLDYAQDLSRREDLIEADRLGTLRILR